VRPLSFVEVTKATSAPSSEPFEVELVSGERVRIPWGFRRRRAVAASRRARTAPVIPSAVRIYVCTGPQDMRRSFDGLSLAVEQRLEPLAGFAVEVARALDLPLRVAP
jgi:hypothetical protein